MTFTCACPYCPATLEAPEEYRGKPVKCAACQGEFIAEKPAEKPPTILPPPKPISPPGNAVASSDMASCTGAGCLGLATLFVMVVLVNVCSSHSSPSPPSDGGREFRIQRETERIKYDRAKGLRDALEHIEAKERARY